MTKTADKTSPSTKQAPTQLSPVQSKCPQRMRTAILDADNDLFQIKCLISTLHHLTHKDYLDEQISTAIYGVAVGLETAHKGLHSCLYGGETV